MDLRALAAVFPEDQSSVASTHTRQLTTTYNSSSRTSCTLLGTYADVHACTHTHTQFFFFKVAGVAYKNNQTIGMNDIPF